MAAGTARPTSASHSTAASANQGKRSAAGTKTSEPAAIGSRPRAPRDGSLGLRGCIAYAYAAENDRCRGEQDSADDEATRLDRQLVDRRDDESERQRAQEVPAVEPDRLGDELADRALGRWKRRRHRTLRPLRSPRHGRRGYCAAASSIRGSASASASSARPILQRDRSPSAISFEIARTSMAGTPASAHARSTAKPSIPSTRNRLSPWAESAHGRARADRERERLGHGLTHRGE